MSFSVLMLFAIAQGRPSRVNSQRFCSVSSRKAEVSLLCWKKWRKDPMSGGGKLYSLTELVPERARRVKEENVCWLRMNSRLGANWEAFGAPSGAAGWIVNCEAFGDWAAKADSGWDMVAGAGTET